jgi:hypothetical protein
MREQRTTSVAGNDRQKREHRQPERQEKKQGARDIHPTLYDVVARIAAREQESRTLGNNS